MTDGSKITEGLRLAFDQCPKCGEKSLTYGHWLRWCSRRECDWCGPQPPRVRNL
jgi:predicted RNA-binding Zn-ribbon protein involved in translation (DUF1610 family)